MSPIAVHAQMRRWRHHAVVLAVLLAAFVGILAVHHGAPAMGAAHHGSDTVAVAKMCFGVFTAIGAAVAAVAIGLIALGRWRPALLLYPSGVLDTARPPEHRTRAGPTLALLCVIRR